MYIIRNFIRILNRHIYISEIFVLFWTVSTDWTFLPSMTATIDVFRLLTKVVGHGNIHTWHQNNHRNNYMQLCRLRNKHRHFHTSHPHKKSGNRVKTIFSYKYAMEDTDQTNMDRINDSQRTLQWLLILEKVFTKLSIKKTF